jgi:hypothetical protein
MASVVEKVALYFDNGAILLASTDDNDFDQKEKLDFENDADDETSCFHFSIIWGEDIENVAIISKGIIDSNRKDRSGPKTIGLKRCKHATIRDITIKNAGNFRLLSTNQNAEFQFLTNTTWYFYE